MFDTRQNIFLLLDHKEYYGSEKSLTDAEDLIKDISSLTLLNYISGFSVNLYLNENSENSGKIQAYLIDCLVGKTGKDGIEKWKSVIQKQFNNGHSPILLWNYSNLLFYSIIFKTFNQLTPRDLTGAEAQKVFTSYLIINSIVNNKILIEEKEILEAAAKNQVEDVVMPRFIYQKDYSSSTDFSNQVTRGVMFFQYLENHFKYSSLVKKYYKSKNITGYLKMFKNLMILFTEIRIEVDLKQRNQLAKLQEYFIEGEIDLPYLETLCVNSEIYTYNQDHSFGTLRNKFLFRINQFDFFILDVNFLIDQFYKAQVFSFNAFLKSKKITDDFLSIKAKEFTEEIYLPTVIKTCFPNYEKYFGEACRNSNNEELCDVYLRDGNKICLIEFKDVLLNATVKNSADKEKLYREFDKKFVSNQKSKPKGISQLLNASKDIELNSISFDSSIPKSHLEIYPIVVYTDFSFGVEGLNKIYKEKFRAELDALTLLNVTVHDATFINLNFFEIREDYLQQNLLNLFTMIEEYHKHTLKLDFHLTNFEVFSRFYMNEYVAENLGLPSSYQNLIAKIIAAK